VGNNAVVQIVIQAKNLTKSAFNETLNGAKDLKQRIGKEFSGVQGMLAGLGIAVGGGAALKYLFDANAEYQALTARLQTFTGSAESAKATVQQLALFAAQTPFELQDSVNAFTTLRVMGVEPTLESMRGLGNVASAFGEQLPAVTDAVRSLVAGQTEPIRRYVQQVHVMGNKVQITANGVTKTLRLNAAEITNFMAQVGNTKFAGAMEVQMNTLGGQVSNVKDNLWQLAAAMGDAGAGGAALDLLKTFNDWLGSLRDSPSALRYWVNLTVVAVSSVAQGFVGLVKIAFNVGKLIGSAFAAVAMKIEVAMLKAFRAVATAGNNVLDWVAKVTGVDLGVRFADVYTNEINKAANLADDFDAGFKQAAAGITEGFVKIGNAAIDFGAATVANFDDATSAVKKLKGGLKDTGDALDLFNAKDAVDPKAAAQETSERIDLLVELLHTEHGRAAALDALMRLEHGLHEAMNNTNRSLEERGRIAKVHNDLVDKAFKGNDMTPEPTVVDPGNGLTQRNLGVPELMKTAQAAPASGDGSSVTGVFDAITAGAQDAALATTELGNTVDVLVGTTIAQFSESWGNAFEAVGAGSLDVGKAIAQAGKQAIGDVALAKGRETALDAGKALAQGFTNPAKLLEAAKLFAISAGYMTLGGALGGRGGRGGASGGGASASAKGDSDVLAKGDKGTGTIVVEGGFLDMNDPRQAEAFENAMNKLKDQRRIEIVSSGSR
jgi:hypothetical protein